MSNPSSERPDVARAILPAAGLGTRLRPLTQAIPKEMLPLGRKPVLEYVVEELRAAGIQRLLFVVSPDKVMIRGYFGDGAAWGVRCDYAIQSEMRGLGDAILCGEAWTEGCPCVVAFGDTIIESRVESRESREKAGFSRPALSLPVARLIETHQREQAAVTILTELVTREQTRKYGIVQHSAALPDAPTEPFPLAGIVEKPMPEEAPSRMAVSARYVLGPEVFPSLHRVTPGPDGEIRLTDAVADLLSDGLAGWAVPLRPGEARRDIGSWETYLTAAARAAAADPEFGARVLDALKGERLMVDG